ncbi:MAG TPA: GAF and ANTAR domain-containing protein [Mycobacterium sp.]|nr:GAF and ANTAR domain-containing protein [Mycobacterium sp.]HUH69712.1 GAF and ANTAR domain-containing protein [Mycobacterium sp.]
MSPRHACLACLEGVGVSGASLVLTGGTQSLEPVYVTDSHVREVEELQATLGQGPGTDALESGRPILVGDLAAPMSTRRWPMFAREVGRLGVCAMYSLPLALGAIRVGVLDLYNDTPGHLDQDQLVDALVYADTALLLVIDAQSGIATPANGDHPDGLGPVLWHAQVHQAAGMVSEQLGVSALEALVRLRGYAYSHDKRLTDVARSVVERQLRFHPDDAKPAIDDGRR